MSYQWQRGTGTGIMTDIAGAAEATYRIPSATLADHKTLFRCVVSNASGNATSAAEILFVTAGARTNRTAGRADLLAARAASFFY